MIYATHGGGTAMDMKRGARTGVVAVIAIVAALCAIGVAAADSTPGSDQYSPGFQWGDPNQNHAGPPKLTRIGAATARKSGSVLLLSVRVKVDEQADLVLRIADPKGRPVKILRQWKGGQSSVGGKALKGAPASTVKARILFPRLVKLSLGLSPKLQPGGYRLTIVAKDPSGKSSTLRVPFTIR
jgi:hypothetical protein